MSRTRKIRAVSKDNSYNEHTTCTGNRRLFFFTGRNVHTTLSEYIRMYIFFKYYFNFVDNTSNYNNTICSYSTQNHHIDDSH